MHIVVTGGAGFVGSHVCEKLLKRGDTVTVIDSISDYYSVEVKHDALDILKTADNSANKLTVHKIDISNAASLEAVFNAIPPVDVVCHLAAQAGVRYSIEHCAEVARINTMGSINLFDLCHKRGISRIVCASTSSVYGDTSRPPFSEDQPADKPVSHYAASKRSMELFAYSYYHLHKMSFILLRFFTVYGPRGRPDMAAFKFIDAVHRGKPIQRFGDGSALRDFTYIDDIVDGVVSAIDRLANKPATSPEYMQVNLGGGAMHTVNEMIAYIENHLGKKALINDVGEQQGDVPLTSADQTRARAVLGFAPKVSLDEGLKRTVNWYLGSRCSK